MKIHLVWAVLAGTREVQQLYIGEDGAAAEAIFEENHLDGEFEEVKWSHDVRHYRHTTPAVDGCKPGFKFQKAPVAPAAETPAPVKKKK